MSIGALSPSTILPKSQTSNNNIFSLLSTSPFSLSNPIHTLPFPLKLHLNLKSSNKSPQFSSQPLHGAVSHDDDDDEPPIGDCLVYEEGIFDDPFLHTTPNPNNQDADISPENLIPEKWLDVQKELNITKKERRKLSQQLEFGRKVERRRQELQPIDSKVYEKFKYEKLKQLKPVMLDKVESKITEENVSSGEVITIRGRVAPRNPRLAVYGGGLEDIDHVFNSGSYKPGSAEKSDGTRKLFSKEEKILMNRRVPDLAVASSGKWHPLHTLAASGEFYLVNTLLKHNLDINAPDKDGLTAIHKAILGKKQAIFNFLLRESANPFVRVEDGATLMHYAVRTASTQMIKILLLYNVDINLQDNDGWTPLHLAVQSRRTDIVRLLLIKGADETLKNRDGLTALDICLNSGRDTRTYELIKLIKRLPR